MDLRVISGALCGVLAGGLSCIALLALFHVARAMIDGEAYTKWMNLIVVVCAVFIPLGVCVWVFRWIRTRLSEDLGIPVFADVIAEIGLATLCPMVVSLFLIFLWLEKRRE
jgi:hypothetical protein